jgi:hypothetical protein
MPLAAPVTAAAAPRISVMRGFSRWGRGVVRKGIHVVRFAVSGARWRVVQGWW